MQLSENVRFSSAACLPAADKSAAEPVSLWRHFLLIKCVFTHTVDAHSADDFLRAANFGRVHATTRRLGKSCLPI